MKKKEQRFHLRPTIKQKAAIEQAALLQQKSITSFILEAAYETAESVICEQANIVLCAADWKQFCHALDRPQGSNTALKKVMNRKSGLKKDQSIHLNSAVRNN
jgi:uncharacterized protein (DUF1778 family)